MKMHNFDGKEGIHSENAEKIEFSAVDFVPVLQEILEQGDSVCLNVTGTSMSPTLRNRIDSVELVSCKKYFPKKYDILFFQRDDGTYVLHRMLKVDSAGRFVMNGDGQNWREMIRQDQVIAVVRQICRKGRWFTVSEPGYVWYVVIWTKFVGIRPLIFKMAHVAVKIQRGIQRRITK